MELNFFTPANFEKPKRVTRPLLSISKANVMRINQPLYELLGVRAGDKVIFGQDPDDKRDWYLGKSNDGFMLKPAGKTDSLIISSQGLARLLCECMRKDGELVRIPVSNEGVAVKEYRVHCLIFGAIEK